MRRAEELSAVKKLLQEDLDACQQKLQFQSDCYSQVGGGKCIGEQTFPF